MPDLTCSDVQVGYTIGKCPTKNTREVTFFVQNGSSVPIRCTLDAENDGTIDFTSGAVDPGQDLEHTHVYRTGSSVDAVIEVTAPDGTACSYAYSIEVGDCEPIPPELYTPGDEPAEREGLEPEDEPPDPPPDEEVTYEYGGAGGVTACGALCALLIPAVAIVLAAAALTLSANIVSAIGGLAVGSAIGINAASLATAIGGPLMLFLILAMTFVCDDGCKIARCILKGMIAGTVAIALLGLFGLAALVVAAVIVALLTALIIGTEIAVRRRCRDQE